MNRREIAFLLLSMGTALRVKAQQAKASRAGFLTSRSRPIPPNRDAFSEAFQAGMQERGYVVGRNLIIEWRYLEGPSAGLNDLAADLVRLNVEVIVAYGTAAVVMPRPARTWSAP